MKFKKDDIVWVCDNNYGWMRVKVIKAVENYYHVKFLNKNSAFGIPKHRIFSDDEFHKIHAEKMGSPFRDIKAPEYLNKS